MKVLFLSNLFPDTAEPYRGLDNATLLHYLRSACDIRVIAPRPALPWKRFSEKRCRPVDSQSSPVYPKTFYVPKAGSLLDHHLFAHAIAGPMQQLRREFPFDTILCSWTFPDTAAVARVAEQMKLPFVSIVQGSDAHVYLRMPWRRPTIVSALNKASSVITRSAKLSQLLEEAGVAKSKLHPIYNGVDLNHFRPSDTQTARRELNLSTELPMLLFVGNFLPVKNPLLLLHTHAQVCKERPCQLVMIGGGPLEPELRRLAGELGTAANIVFAGRQTADQVARYMQAADILCLSSDNEGVPNVILEAFATGLRVVSTDVGGISEVLSADVLGKLVPRGDHKSLATSITALLQELPERQKIRAHGENVSWEKTATAYMELLQRSTAARV